MAPILALVQSEAAARGRVGTGDPNLLACAACRAAVSAAEHLFAMGSASPRHSFQNPSGFRFTILTLLRCRSLVEATTPTPEHTWFPGYSWSIVVCAGCGAHLGWRYVAPGLEPPEFYGLIEDRVVWVARGGPSERT